MLHRCQPQGWPLEAAVLSLCPPLPSAHNVQQFTQQAVVEGKAGVACSASPASLATSLRRPCDI